MFNLFGDRPFKCFTGEYGERTVENRSYRGVHPIAIDDIVGSVGRCHDFDSGFNFKWADTHHFNQIKEMMDGGEVLPAIKVYQVDDEYYILDGHHRVVAGRKTGREFIDADIIELKFAGKKKDIDYGDCPRREFEEKTGLFGVIYRSRDKYRQVMERLSAGISELGEGKSLKKVAANWYHNEYLPEVAGDYCPQPKGEGEHS